MAISLSMPVRPDEYRRRDLHPIFQMNLPEGYVLEQLRNRLAKIVNVDPMSFALRSICDPRSTSSSIALP